MKDRSRVACISAAVAAFMGGGGGGSAQARDLTWDYSPGDGVPHDGTGTWDLTSPNWVDSAAPGTNTTWDNSFPDSAIFGGGASGLGADPNPPYNVDLAANIIVQNLTLAEVPGNAQYSISSFSGGSLTLNGNLIKSGNDGFLNFFTNTTLAAGNHTVTLRDTPNDGIEFIYNGVITGSGGLTLDNDIYEAWGTLGFNQDNSYTGVTNIDKGRVVLTTSGGLGSNAAGSGTTIGAMGTLAFFGAGTTPFGSLNVTEPITITRDTYAGGEFDRYRAAIQNNDGNNTISGPLVIDSVDGRVASNGGTLTISSDIAQGPSVTAATLSIGHAGGSFTGVVELTGNNTALLGGITIIRGTASVFNENNLAGPSSPITFSGDGYLRINGGFMTNFGSHVVNLTTFGGGIDTPDVGQLFTINESLTGTQFNKRGFGTVNLNGTNVFSGNNFTDLGVVNINGDTSAGSIRIRNGTVNVNSGGVLTTTNSFTNIGQDTGENGTLNILGTGIVNAANHDFNVSDNPGTTGTLNAEDDSQLTVTGRFFIGKSNGAVGTLNIRDNATVNANRTGGESFVIGRGTNATGIVNKEGGTLNIAGEMWVGNNGGGNGTFTQTAGNTTVNNWIAVGRNQSTGTLNLDSGTLTKQGTGNTEIDFAGGGQGILNVRNDAVFNVATGELWIGQSGGSNGQLNIQDTGAVTTNSWTVMGRGGGTGTLSMSGSATLSKVGGGGSHFIIADGNNSIGTATVAGSSSINVSVGELWVGQGGGSNGTLNIQDSGAASVNNWLAIGRAGGTGTVNMSSGTFTKTGGGNAIIAAGGGSNGTFNQTGGTFNNTTGSETWIAEGGPTGVWNFSGGIANVGRLDVGRNGGGTATLNLSNTAALTSGILRFGESGSVSGTVNLDGGTIQATQVVAGNSSGAKTLNLNGGLLKAGASSTTWMDGPITANVKAGGARLDSNGFDASVNTPLVHDALLGATPDGGLTKSGAGSFTLAAANTYTGGTTVNAGTLIAAHADAFNAGRALIVNAGATARAEVGLAAALDAGALTIAATGKLDLNDAGLVRRNGGSGATGQTSTQQLTSYLKSGLENGGNFDWLGEGISSTKANADNAAAGSVLYGLGILQNNLAAAGAADATTTDQSAGNEIYTAFEGRSVALNDTLVKFTYMGDGDLDGQVTSTDYSLIDNGFAFDLAGWLNGDFDYSGTIDSTDYALIDNAFAFQVGTLSEAFQARYEYSVSRFGQAYIDTLAGVQAGVVPEPGTVGLLGLAGAGLALRRRRRQQA